MNETTTPDAAPIPPGAADVMMGYDPDLWVALPTGWPFKGHDTATTWVELTLGDICSRSPSITRSRRRHARAVLDYLARWPSEGESRFLLAPNLDELTAILRVQYAWCEGERESMLRQLVLASDQDAVEPPALERFASEGLGDGWRGVRYSDTDGVLEATAVYAFRSEPYDLRISCHVGPPELVPVLMPIVDAFVHGTSVVPAE